MADRDLQKYIDQYRAHLHKQRDELIAMPPDQAMARILSAPQPKALVRSLDEEDLYLLIKALGPEDALPLLALSSLKQWEFVFDIELWKKDRLEIKSAEQWINLLMRADAGRLANWCIKKKIELAELFLYYNIDVRVREHDQDPSDFGEGYFTLDNVYYVRIIESIDPTVDEEKNEEAEAQKKRTLRHFLERIAAEDQLFYQKLMLETPSIIPAETEEEQFRLRNVRLAEKGFLPFDEAIGVYQPMSPETLLRRSAKQPADQTDPFDTTAPMFPVGMLDRAGAFAQALTEVKADETLMQLQSELAALCNQIVVADGKTVADREALRGIVRKACGYIDLGLERMIPQKGVDSVRQRASLIRQYPLSGIFRVGFGEAMQLKWQAEKWFRHSWTKRRGLALAFWDEKGMGVLGGLLIKKPLYFDNYESGALYRDFEKRPDIEITRRILGEIVAVDGLFDRMDPPVQTAPQKRFVNFKNVLLTLWTRRRLHLSDDLTPIPLAEFRSFFRELFGEAKLSETPISDEWKSDFLAWAAEMSNQSMEETAKRRGEAFASIFRELESEYGRVAPEDLDPRFVRHWLIS